MSLSIVNIKYSNLPPLPPSPKPKPKELQINSDWNAPLPKMLIKHLKLSHPFRVTHEEALNILAKKYKCSVNEFLNKSKKEVYSRWFTVQINNKVYIQDPFKVNFIK
jgi:hypothetical protein